MNLLVSTPHSSTKYLLDVNYTHLYQKMTKALGHEPLILALPDFGDSQSNWYTPMEGKIRPYSSASEEEKDLIGDLLREHKEEIEKKLLSNTELSPYVKHLFSIPGEDSIYIVEKASGEIELTLANWACKKVRDYSGHDVLGVIINRPKSDHTTVRVRSTYSDGSVISGRPLYFRYRNRPTREFKPDSEGFHSFGQLKNGSQFSISLNKEENLPYDPVFTVRQDTEVYEAVFPYHVSVEIRVQNQIGEPVENCSLTIKGNGLDTEAVSDSEGMIYIPEVEVKNEPLIVSDSKNIKNFQLSKTAVNAFTFEIEETLFREAVVRIVDKEGNPATGYPIYLNDEDEPISSDNEGCVYPPNTEVDSVLEVKDGHDEYNKKSYKITVEENEFIFEVNPPKEKFVTIRCLGYKKEPLADNPTDININGEQLKLRTDENGEIHLKESDFEGVKSFIVGIHLPDKQKKIKNKKVKYTPEKDLYELRLKKFNKWLLWLLLIPLILLLLLLNFQKDAVVQVTDEAGTAVPSALVTFDYERSHLFKDGKFFYKKAESLKDTADRKGIVSFKKLHYSGFSFVTGIGKKAVITAESECHANAELKRNYHFLSLFKRDTVYIELAPRVGDIEMLVVDAENGMPINGANVIYTTQINDEVLTDTVQSNASGEALLAGIPICGKGVEELKVEAAGYESMEWDTPRTYSELAKDSDLRRIELTPLKESIEFFVVSCETGEPIPDAVATIEISDDQNKFTQTVITNIDGQGRGSYDELRILSEIQIKVEKKYFKPAKLPKSYTVQEFASLPDSLRTICMEPESNSMDFKTVVEGSGIPIPGTENKVIIERDGKELIESIVSNRNGIFSVADLRIGDKISIVSSKEPAFEPNNTKVTAADAIELLEGPVDDRIIPLKPRIYEATFSTIDEYDGFSLPDVNLRVLIDGKDSPLTTSGRSARFTVAAPYGSTLSIIASKEDYKTNDYTIRNQIMDEAFINLSDKEREIPLRITPCETSTVSRSMEGDQKEIISQFDLKTSEGAFKLRFNTYTAPDSIIVYGGRKEEMNRKNVLYEYGGGTFLWKTVNIDKKGHRFITVHAKVMNDHSGSIFDYELSCPDN